VKFDLFIPLASLYFLFFEKIITLNKRSMALQIGDKIPETWAQIKMGND
jgi:hypothetical protein